MAMESQVEAPESPLPQTERLAPSSDEWHQRQTYRWIGGKLFITHIKVPVLLSVFLPSFLIQCIP